MTTLNTNRNIAGQIVLVAWLLLGVAIPANRAFSTDERQLSFYHTHTRETLNITYSAGGKYLQPALQQINKFLLDFRTGDETAMDPELLDLLYDARQSLGSDATYEIISAYRSPTTNEMLRDKSGGVAKNSQHLLGKAIDVRLRGVDSADLRDAAIGLQRGGVGYYLSSDFVHMDTGRVRRW
jgi:uncharacterized protein YcbK (DUF882 family)